MDDEAYFLWCQDHAEWRIERSSEGDIEIMAPAGWETGGRNASITAQLYEWARQDGRGVAADSSTGSILPNSAARSPDASWILKERVRGILPQARHQFLPLCPDFVIELRSPSDRLPALQVKMEEYVANGVALGWLLDPMERRVHVYRPGQPPEIFHDPASIHGLGPVEGFVLDLGPIFDLDL